jgi:hypothetical protein
MKDWSPPYLSVHPKWRLSSSMEWVASGGASEWRSVQELSRCSSMKFSKCARTTEEEDEDEDSVDDDEGEEDDDKILVEFEARRGEGILVDVGW